MSSVGMLGDQGWQKVKFYQCNWCFNWPVHPTWRTCLHPFGQRSCLHCSGCQTLDCDTWYLDSLHRAKKPLGKRLLRELQWQVQGRTVQRRDLLHPTESANHHQTIEETRQYEETLQCIRLSITSTWSHCIHGSEANDALTINMDQSDVAAQF